MINSIWTPIEPGCEMPEVDRRIVVTILDTDTGERFVDDNAFYGNAEEAGEKSDPNKPYIWMSNWDDINVPIEDPKISAEDMVIAWAYPIEIKPYTGRIKREL